MTVKCNLGISIQQEGGQPYTVVLPGLEQSVVESTVNHLRDIGSAAGAFTFTSEGKNKDKSKKTQKQQEADMSGNITKTELEALLRANKSEVDVVAANIQKEMAEWREQQNAQMTEVNKTLSILNVKMDERFENQKQSSTRIQWMVGVAIAAAALVPAYFGMVKSEPAPMQQPTIVYVQQPAPAVQATPPQVQPAPQPVPQEPTPEPQKAPATKQ